MLKVKVLGELALEVDGVAVELPTSRRARMLLGWLALRSGPQPRATLAARLWPDTRDESARTNLRNAAWGLRRALGPHADEWLLATRDTLELVDREDVWVDARAFHALAVAGRLEEAAELAHGEPLEGLEHEWIDDAREEHREALASLFERLAAAAQEAGDAAGAVRWTRRRAALDPLSEEPVRALMQRLAEAGDRAEALTVYSRLAEQLRIELRMAPSPATRALAAEIRAYGAGAAAAPLPPRLAAAATASVFVGRRRELRELREAWHRAAEGPAQLALVAGEPGIGKTRLAAELGRELQGAGAHVLYGAADEDALVPYQPLAEALRGQWPPIAVRSDADRLAMFDAVAEALGALAASTPVLLVLDDLHWADRPSVQLLRYVCRTIAGARLLVVALLRTTELEDATANAIASLRRELPTVEIVLLSLGSEDVAAIVEAAGHGAGVAGVVQAGTGGNPFFIHETLRAHADGAPLAGPPPGRVRELIRRRAARLGPRHTMALEQASILGREFDARTVEQLIGSSPDEVANTLDSATAAGLIDEVADRLGRYTFTHALVREALYADLGARRRALLHQRAGQALQELHTDDLEPYVAEIAHHLCAGAAAGDAGVAVTWALRAAEQAAGRIVYEEAIAFYNRALDLLAPEDAMRRRILGKRAVCYAALTHLALDAPRAGFSPRTAPG